MQIEETALSGALLITPKKFGDERGFFSETFNQRLFEQHVPNQQFVQDNHSLSRDIGVLRGLHFQLPPFAQGKLVRCPRGRVLDVIVDIRKGSKTYGNHIAVELSADNWQQLWVPVGFAHGFCTLEENSEFCYKVTNPYAPDHEGGLMFNDPDLAIDWPITEDALTLSGKDIKFGAFKEFDSPFVFGENA